MLNTGDDTKNEVIRTTKDEQTNKPILFINNGIQYELIKIKDKLRVMMYWIY